MNVKIAKIQETLNRQLISFDCPVGDGIGVATMRLSANLVDCEVSVEFDIDPPLSQQTNFAYSDEPPGKIAAAGERIELWLSIEDRDDAVVYCRLARDSLLMIEEAPGETLEVGRVIKVTLAAAEFQVAVVGQPLIGSGTDDGGPGLAHGD